MCAFESYTRFRSGCDPVHKATVVPRGEALGVVAQVPDGDQLSVSKNKLLGLLDICLAGRVAEELVFGEKEATSGAASDIDKATRIARSMIASYGFSKKIGLVSVTRLLRDSAQDGATISQNLENAVDEEVSSFIRDSYDRVKAVLSKYRAKLDAIAQGLIEFETLSGAEIVDLMNGKSINSSAFANKPSRELSETINRPRAKVRP